MVQITKFKTDENIPDEEFQPKDKYGILVAGRNLDTGFIFVPSTFVPSMPRWSPHIPGNDHIYDWELLMTGTIDFGRRSPLNTLDDLVNSYKGEDGITRISRTKPRKIVRTIFAPELELYENGGKSNSGYKEVAKVWPGTKEVLPEFERAVERFAGLSDDDTLTTIILFSHGDKGRIQMGDSWLPYKKLLEDSDKIHGRKAVFVYACHSGSFLRTLRFHPQRKNYAAITSYEADNLSLNWNNRILNNNLRDHFSRGKRYSDLKLEPLNDGYHKQRPQMLRYFDVQLIKR